MDDLASFLSREADAMRQRQAGDLGVNEGYSERARHRDKDEDKLRELGEPLDASFE